jgi:hypothetical protein
LKKFPEYRDDASSLIAEVVVDAPMIGFGDMELLSQKETTKQKVADARTEEGKFGQEKEKSIQEKEKTIQITSTNDKEIAISKDNAKSPLHNATRRLALHKPMRRVKRTRWMKKGFARMVPWLSNRSDKRERPTAGRRRKKRNDRGDRPKIPVFSTHTSGLRVAPLFGRNRSLEDVDRKYIIMLTLVDRSLT